MTARPNPAEMLRIREWLLAELGSSEGADAVAWTAVAACTPESWNAFLVEERCALTVQALLPRSGEGHKGQSGSRYSEHGPFSGSILDMVRLRAAVESQYVLAARMRLAQLAELASKHPWKIIVLKGVVPTASGAPIFASDVDVLLDPDQATQLVAELDRLGDTHVPGRSSHHFPTRGGQHGAPIEVHLEIPHREQTSIHGLCDNAIPLPGQKGLWRLAPCDHLWHVLTHGVIHHPERQGRLRELILLRDSLHECSPADLHELDRRIRKHALSASLQRVLDCANVLRTRQVREDPFRDLAIRIYAFGIRHDYGRLPRAVPRRARIMIGRGESYTREIWRDLSTPVENMRFFLGKDLVSLVSRWLLTVPLSAYRIIRVSRAILLAEHNRYETRRLRRMVASFKQS